MDISQMDDYVTFQEAAMLVGVTTNTIHMWNRVGRIHAVKFKGLWLTTKPELRRALEDYPLVGHVRRIGTPSPELTEAVDAEAAVG